MDPALGSDIKPALAVKVDVAFHADGADAHLRCFFESKIKQDLAVAFTLKIGVNTNRTERHDRQCSAVIGLDLGADEHHMTDDPSADLQT